MSDLVSIIVPVYNGEKYIKHCLESLLKQQYENIEILVIDDGSTDCSREIIEVFSEIDSRIVLLSKDNTGVSSSRNLGMEHAKGKYIAFCDSDDVVHSAFIKTLVESIKSINSDMSIVSFSKEISELESTNEESEIMTFGDVYNWIIEGNGYIWNKMFKASIIKDNHLKFDEDISMCEDTVFLLEYMKYSNKKTVSINSDILYYYRTVEFSVSNKKINSCKLTEILAREKVVKLLEESGCSKECLETAVYLLLGAYCFYLKDILFKIKDKKIRDKWIPYIVSGFVDLKRKWNITFSKDWKFNLKFYYILLEITGRIVR